MRGVPLGYRNNLVAPNIQHSDNCETNYESVIVFKNQINFKIFYKKRVKNDSLYYWVTHQ